MTHPNVHIFEFPECLAEESLLSKGELADLKSLGYAGNRRLEWILGRAAMHRALEGDFPGKSFEIGTTSHGSPRVDGSVQVSVSLSHDGNFFGVALAKGKRNVGIDLCRTSHSSRLSKILPRLVSEAPDLPASLIWASLEAPVKMHKLGISALLDTRWMITTQDDGLLVTGLGGVTRVSYKVHPEYFVAWCCAELTCT